MCMWAPSTGTGACHLADEWKKLDHAWSTLLDDYWK